MSSVIHYRFKNTLTPFEQVHFDGHSLSALDVKRAIIATKNLVNHFSGVCDFDLLLTNAQTGEVYREDGMQIPRNTSIIIRRIPASKGKPLILEKPGNVVLQPNQSSTAENATATVEDPDESAKMLAVMQQSAAAAYGDMSQQQSANRGGRGGRSGRFSAGPPRAQPGGGAVREIPAATTKPPPGYRCYRCGQSNHWIHYCPTNGDSRYDGKSYRCVPNPNQRNFLQPIEDTATGEQFEAYRGQFGMSDSSAAAAVAAKTNNTPSPVSPSPEIVCVLCKQLLRDPQLTPCCRKSACDECLRQALLSDDFICPFCGEVGVDVSAIIPNEDLKNRVEQYQKSQNSSSVENVVEVKPAIASAVSNEDYLTSVNENRTSSPAVASFNNSTSISPSTSETGYHSSAPMNPSTPASSISVQRVPTGLNQPNFISQGQVQLPSLRYQSQHIPLQQFSGSYPQTAYGMRQQYHPLQNSPYYLAQPLVAPQQLPYAYRPDGSIMYPQYMQVAPHATNSLTGYYPVQHTPVSNPTQPNYYGASYTQNGLYRGPVPMQYGNVALRSYSQQPQQSSDLHTLQNTAPQHNLPPVGTLLPTRSTTLESQTNNRNVQYSTGSTASVGSLPSNGDAPDAKYGMHSEPVLNEQGKDTASNSRKRTREDSASDSDQPAIKREAVVA